MKRVLIVGHRGQDGRLLRERLEHARSEVIGYPRGEGSLADRVGIADFISARKPSEIYYLPAYHHSAEDLVAEDDAELYRRSEEVHVTGLLHFLEAIRTRSPRSRLFYAASSHVFGDPASSLQDETTPFDPNNIYGITKTAGISCCRFYRATHGVFAAAGILYNHESPYRKQTFVSQKIVQGALAIKAGRQDKLVVGDLSTRVDWGAAADYVDAMERILALDAPDDFVVATGETHSIQDFAEIAFGNLDLDWRTHLVENPRLLRKKISNLCGNAAKLRERTGWQPSVTFEEMVSNLVTYAKDAR